MTRIKKEYVFPFQKLPEEQMEWLLWSLVDHLGFEVYSIYKDGQFLDFEFVKEDV